MYTVETCCDLNCLLELILDVEIVLRDSHLLILGDRLMSSGALHEYILARFSSSIFEKPSYSLLLVRYVSNVLSQRLKLIP